MDVDRGLWLNEMGDHARSAIHLAASQMGDETAAGDWTLTHQWLSFTTPTSMKAQLGFSRPDAGGESPRTGRNAMTFDYLPHLVNRTRPFLDADVRAAVLRQIVGRRRDAEIARLSPGERNPAWATCIDILSWSILSHFLTQHEIERIVSEDMTDADAPEDQHPAVCIERRWQDPRSSAAGLHCCHLTPDLDRLCTDGLEFRLAADRPLVRIESHPKAIHVEIHGCSLPETATVGLTGGHLSRIVDDPVLARAAGMLTIRSISMGVDFLSIRCDPIWIRCAPPPQEATFSWEKVRDPGAVIPNTVRILDHGSI